MKKILIYTDCENFAGCENIIPVLLKHKKLNFNYKFSLTYKYSKSYYYGLSKKLKISKHNIYPIKMLSFQVNNSILHKMLKKISSIFELFIMIYEIKILVSHFNNIKPDIVFINNGGYPGARGCRSAAIAAKIFRAKHIYFNVNNIVQPYNSLKRISQYPVDKIVSLSVTKFITASRYAKIKLENTLNLKKSITIRLLNTFNKEKVLKDPLQIKFNLFNEKNILLVGCVGVFKPNKGHYYFFESIRLLKKKFRCNNLKFILIGEGPSLNAYNDFINKFKIRKYIKIIPFKWNIFDYYNAMDIYVHPSIAYDDFPFAVREAMSSRLPVIGSKFAGIPELVKHNVNGILVPPKNSLLLAKAIKYLANNKKLRKKFGTKGLSIYNRELSSKAVIKNYHKLFSGKYYN